MLDIYLIVIKSYAEYFLSLRDRKMALYPCPFPCLHLILELAKDIAVRRLKSDCKIIIYEL